MHGVVRSGRRSSTPGPKSCREKLLDHYTLGEQIGSGVFGVVHMCTKRDTGEEFAVKLIDRVETPENAFKAEAELLRAVAHPNVVKLHRDFTEKCFFCLVVDFYRGGDLIDGAHRHQKNGRIVARTVAHIFYQMLEAVRYLHSHFVAHRDVKADNYLIDTMDILIPDCRVALSDFGSAKKLSKPSERMHDEAGTTLFWAPEVWRANDQSDRHSYGMKADVWAVGVSVHGILEGRQPFKNAEDTQWKALTLRKMASEDAICRELILALMEKDEEARPNAAEAIKHRWFEDMSEFAADARAHPSRGSRASEVVESEVREDQAREDVAERRMELVERLENHHEAARRQASGARCKPRRFLQPRFHLEDRHTGASKAIFEWWTQACLEKAGFTYALHTQESDVADAAPPEDIGELLEKHGICVAMFGKDKAKTLAQLRAEVDRGASRLLLDATTHRKLVRVVDAVLLRVVFVDSSGLQRVLVEQAEQYADGRRRNVCRLPGTKREPAESVPMTAVRVIREILGVNAGIELGVCRETFEQEEDSPSFPGIMTVYRKEVVECVLTFAAPLDHLGLPGFESWQYQKDVHSSTKFFGWFTESECLRSGVQLRGRGGEDMSCLVPAPAGGSSSTGSLWHASAQHAEMVSLRLVSADGAQLVQVQQMKMKGRKASLDDTTQLPCTQRRSHENEFHAAWRLIQKLGVDEDCVRFHTDDMMILTQKMRLNGGDSRRIQQRVLTAEIVVDGQPWSSGCQNIEPVSQIQMGSRFFRSCSKRYTPQHC